ncbi:restriction endonuclease subunit S [Bacillus sp. Nf3]|uniref:restriction endonuclease subunit S n=1 Tax=Bacillus sp. Nf3 TaxID=2116541 RepID=UPI000D165D02|nr:restriction endonuclease subunit S [Bacillus sp. Nf3]PTA86651.1 restriction endonuclease subunit S [Bacillus sp. Nf3]
MSDNITNSPQIRFAGFTDAWEQRKLGEMMEVTSVKRIHQSDWTDEGVRFLRARDIVSASKGEEPTEYLYISQEKYEEYSRICGKVKLGDLLVTGVGSIGVPMLVNHEEPLYFKDGNIIWFKNKKQLDGFFFYYSFLGKNVQKYIRDVAGIGTVGTYTIASGKKTPIQIPSFEEQERIGTFFNDLDHHIILHQRELELLKETKKSLLQKMFPKDGANVPEIRFAGFTDAWEQRELKDVVEVSSGRDYKHLSDGDIPVYGTGGYMLSVNEALSYDKDAIGIGRKGTIDKPYLLRAPFWTVDTLFYAVPKEKNNLDFVHSVFQRVNWKQKDESTGVPSLSKTTINAVNVAVPECDEQAQIGHFFSQLDNLITLHQRELNTLKNLKKSLLQQMFI